MIYCQRYRVYLLLCIVLFFGPVHTFIDAGFCATVSNFYSRHRASLLATGSVLGVIGLWKLYRKKNTRVVPTRVLERVHAPKKVAMPEKKCAWYKKALALGSVIVPGALFAVACIAALKEKRRRALLLNKCSCAHLLPEDYYNKRLYSAKKAKSKTVKKQEPKKNFNTFLHLKQMDALSDIFHGVKETCRPNVQSSLELSNYTSKRKISLFGSVEKKSNLKDRLRGLVVKCNAGKSKRLEVVKKSSIGKRSSSLIGLVSQIGSVEYGCPKYNSLIKEVAILLQQKKLDHEVYDNLLMKRSFLHCILQQCSEEVFLDIFSLLDSLALDSRKELLLAKDSAEQTLLYYAVKRGYVKAVRSILLKMQAWCRKSLFTYLHTHLAGSASVYGLAVCQALEKKSVCSNCVDIVTLIYDFAKDNLTPEKLFDFEQYGAQQVYTCSLTTEDSSFILLYERKLPEHIGQELRKKYQSVFEKK